MNCELRNSSESKVNEKSFALRVYLFKYMYKIWLKIRGCSVGLYLQVNSRWSKDVSEPGGVHWRQAEEPNNATYLLYYMGTTYIYL